MKELKKQQGITLIALVITIIVLLILAGVTLRIVFNGGIIDKSQNAVESYKNSADTEKDKIENLAARLEWLANNKNGGQEDIPEVDYDPQQLFTYEILPASTGKAGDMEGIDSITTLADNSEGLKIAANTMGTVRITGINYDYAFGDMPEYTSGGSGSSSGSGINDPFMKRVEEKYSTLIVPGKVKLDSEGKYNPNGTEYEVTEIYISENRDKNGWYAFYSENTYGMSRVDSIILPNTIRIIGNNAFRGMRKITSIKMSDNLTSIGEYAFYSCNDLTNVTIPNNVTSIGRDAFVGCNLTSITIPSSVTSIGDGAFNYCEHLTSIIVENDNSNYDSRNNCNAIIRKSDNSLIAGCGNTLIPNSVTSIGDNAFYGCGNLTSITIPNSVTSIGDNAFSGCDNLTSITIPNNVTSIGYEAFWSCNNLTNVEIPSSVTSIGGNAFYSLAYNSTIYVQSEAVQALLNGKYHTNRTTVVIDPSKF